MSALILLKLAFKDIILFSAHDTFRWSLPSV